MLPASFNELLTRRGQAFVVVGASVLVVGVFSGLRDVTRVGIFAFSLALASWWAARRISVKLLVGRRLEPSFVPVGVPTQVRLTVAVPQRLRYGTVLVNDEVPHALGARPRFVLDEVGVGWRRDVLYRVESARRGQFSIGPVTARIGDPFGLVQVKRTFGATSVLTVTPKVHPLPSVQLPQRWSGTGDSRPRSLSAAGEEDVTIRPYSRGDDVRRIHWRSSARHNELMVRREEPPWQNRCTILLDTRVSAFGMDTHSPAFEWAVSAAASLALHVLHSGYAVRLVIDDDNAAAWLDAGLASHTTAGTSGNTTGADADLASAADAVVLERLAVVMPHRQSSISGLARRAVEHGGDAGVVLGIFGPMASSECIELARLGRDVGGGVAVLLASGQLTTSTMLDAGDANHPIAQGGWMCVDAHHDDGVAEVWTKALGSAQTQGSGSGASEPGAQSSTDAAAVKVIADARVVS